MTKLQFLLRSALHKTFPAYKFKMQLNPLEEILCIKKMNA